MGKFSRPDQTRPDQTRPDQIRPGRKHDPISQYPGEQEAKAGHLV